MSPDPLRKAIEEGVGAPETPVIPLRSVETLTDSGNATRLVRLHGDRLHHLPLWGKWTVCGPDGFWGIDHGNVRVRELAKDVGADLKDEAAKMTDKDDAKRVFSFAFQSLNARGISGMVDLARGIPGMPLDHEELDANGWLLGVQNGVVELDTGKFREADPKDLMTMQCSVPWDENATAPRFERAMQEWFPDAETRGYVQRAAGSVLLGAQRDHVFLIHYGGGRNGKGTFIRAITRVLDAYASVIHLSLLVETKYSGHDTIKADLFRSRLAVAAETAKRVRLDEASVKNLTGADRITARRMREDPWEFDPTHSLWLQTNHLPEIGGRDTGIWSRIRVVRWENTFEGADQEQDLDDVLASEGTGILRWLVKGCLQWQEHGLDEPEKVVRDTLAYRQAEDVLSRFRTDVGLVFHDDLDIQASALQQLLQEWADAEGLTVPARDVGDWLREGGAEQKRLRKVDADGKRRQKRYWIGVGIPEAEHNTEQGYAL